MGSLGLLRGTTSRSNMPSNAVCESLADAFLCLVQLRCFRRKSKQTTPQLNWNSRLVFTAVPEFRQRDLYKTL